MRSLGRRLDLAWAYTERILPRISSATVLLSLATVTSPAVVGTYSWVLVSVLLLRAIVDNPIRNVATVSVGDKVSERYLRKLISGTRMVGTVCLVVLVILLASFSFEAVGTSVVALILIPLVPSLIARGLMPLARLQQAHAWGAITKARFLSSIIGLIVSLPLVFTPWPFAAAIFFLFLNEAAFAFLCKRKARDIRSDGLTITTHSIRKIKSEYTASAVYQVLGWAESQADRLFIGLIAGTQVLGQYSTSASVAKSGPDAVAGGTSRVLRARLVTVTDLTGRRLVERAIVPGLFLVLLGALLLWLLNATLLRTLLGEEWEQALRAIPILAAAGLPAYLTWNISTIMSVEGSLRTLLPVRICGIFISLPIALLAFQDFALAAWVMFGRDTVVALIAMWFARKWVSIRLLILSVMFLTVLVLPLVLNEVFRFPY